MRDFLQNLQVEGVKTKLSCKTFPSKTALCRERFFAVIALLQSLFSCSHLSLRPFLFAVIVLCSHCALPSLCFAVMVLCGHGSLGNGCISETSRKTFLSRKYKHETVDGQKDQTLQMPTKETPRPQISMLHKALYSFLCVRV